MAKIKGSCVFRNDGDGCLSSKYVNDNTPPFVESCKLIDGSRSPNSKDNFEGRYDTIWLESSSGRVSHQRTELTITARPDGTYQLAWASPQYFGIGMIYDGLLVGAYWN